MRRRSLTGLQERFEASELGRAAISGLIVVILVVIVSLNLPASELQRQVTRIAEPVIRAVGLHQVWGVFAPDPRNIVATLTARVVYDDGTEEVWEPPDGLPFPDSYRDVRWIRFVQTVTAPSQRTVLGEQFARWLARELTTDGRRPKRVTLLETRYTLLAPNVQPDRTPTSTAVVYDFEVAVP
jgi:hypothetical protein